MVASRKSNLSFIEILSVETFMFLLVLIPIVFAPLYYFFHDRVSTKFKADIKSSIFKTILNNYNLSYKISITGYLPKSDIENLNFENSLLTFAYGDDLISGTTNNGNKFRIAEMHSSTLFKNKFDGIVGVLVYPTEEERKQAFQFYKNKLFNSSIKLIHSSHKIYFILSGKKKHFEYKFKNDKLNSEKLFEDFEYFKTLVSAMFENEF